MAVSYEVWRYRDGSGYVLRIETGEVTGYSRLQVAERAPQAAHVTHLRYCGEPSHRLALNAIRRQRPAEWSFEREYWDDEIRNAVYRQRVVVGRLLVLALFMSIGSGIVADVCSSPDSDLEALSRSNADVADAKIGIPAASFQSKHHVVPRRGEALRSSLGGFVERRFRPSALRAGGVMVAHAIHPR